MPIKLSLVKYGIYIYILSIYKYNCLFDLQDVVLNVPPPPPVETMGVSGHIGGAAHHHHHQQQVIRQSSTPVQPLHVQHPLQQNIPLQHHQSTSYHQHHGHVPSNQVCI